MGEDWTAQSATGAPSVVAANADAISHNSGDSAAFGSSRGGKLEQGEAVVVLESFKLGNEFRKSSRKRLEQWTEDVKVSLIPRLACPTTVFTRFSGGAYLDSATSMQTCPVFRPPAERRSRIRVAEQKIPATCGTLSLQNEYRVGAFLFDSFCRVYEAMAVSWFLSLRSPLADPINPKRGISRCWNGSRSAIRRRGTSNTTRPET